MLKMKPDLTSESVVTKSRTVDVQLHVLVGACILNPLPHARAM